MSNTLKFGNGEWYGKEGTILAYNSENNNYKPLPFTFERDSVATRVNKQGLIETVGADQPRIDYLNDSNGALLLEPSRTNLITYSEDYSSFTQNGCSVISNDISFPLGGLADKIQEDSSDTNKHIRPANVSITSGQSYIMSAWFKSDNCDTIALREGSSSGDSITYKFSTGTTSATGTRWTSLNVVNYSNGWRRIDAKYTSTATASMNFRVHLLGNNYNQVINPNPSTYTYQGDGTSGIYMWGLSVEAGSYPTSIIKTEGSAVTRLADSCYQGGLLDKGVLNNTALTLFFNSTLTSDTTNQFLDIISMHHSTASKEIRIESRTNNILYIQQGGVVNSGDNFNSLNLGANSINFKKVAIVLTQTQFKVFADGSQIGSTLNGSYNVNFDSLGFQTFNGAVQTKIQNKDLKLYNTALTDQELIALTQV